jgi:regulatory protein
MDYKEAYAMALRLLNVRFLSEGELRKKLKAKEAGPDICDAVLDKLKSERFIDDERLATEVFRLYARKQQYGRRYIVNRLRMRSLPVPEETEPLDELATAAGLVEKRFSRGAADPRKIARFLQYRGFSPGVISEIIGHVE